MFENLSDELQQQINNLPTIILTPRMKDLTGIRKNNFIYIKPAKRDGYRTYWWALCDCGTIFMIRVDQNNLGCQQCSKKEWAQNIKGKTMKDLSNQKFGKLTALYPLEERKNGHIVWHCKCKCGNEIDVIGNSLTSNNTQSCGCLKKENCYFVQLKENLIGQKFGYLTVLEETNQREYGKIIWKCQCECGKIIYLNTSRLKEGNDTSCGCKKQNSLGVLNIIKLLKENNIIFKQEYTEKTLNKKRFDFAIYDNSNNLIKLLEFDGEQHYRSSGGWNTPETLKEVQQRDKEKNNWAKEHNIPLVRIPYWERDNITLDMIMGDQYLVKEE